jgi:hypothetical protein
LVLGLACAGCAVHASLNPATFEYVYGYGRITDCPGDVPPQLTPALGRKAPAEDLPPVPKETPPTCHTVEVGAMSWQNMIAAFGSALALILPLL